jgi:hypothetical protein
MSKAQVTFPSAADTSAIDIQDAGVLIVSNPGTMNFTGAGVTVTESPTGTAQVDIPGFSLEVQDAGTPIVSNPGTMNFTGAGVTVTNSPAGTAAVDIPDASVKFWTESETAATQQNTRWIPNNVAADVTAVVEPKGTGANTAQRPDGTTTGGNARGNYSTDWQKRRGNANQVASGTDSVISGGRNNRASGTDSFVGGGFGNATTNNSAVIGGGISNTASGSESFVGGGQSNTSSGVYGSILGGQSNSATAQWSTVGGGSSNSVTDQYGFASNNSCVSSNRFGVAQGQSGRAYINSQRGFGFLSGFQTLDFGAFRDTQASSGILSGGTTTLVNTSLIIPTTAFNVWNIEIKFVGYVFQVNGTATGVSVGDSLVLTDYLCIKRVSSVSTILGTATNIYTVNDASMSSASVAYTIGGSQELVITFTAPTFAGGGNLFMKLGASLCVTEIVRG